MPLPLFLSQRALVDAFHIGHVTHQSLAAMHVQIIEHKHPAGSGIRRNWRMNMPCKILFNSILFDRW